MRTFLRKIRLSLLEFGSAKKYFLYAIGEITLVVIGILIALQINNWNEARNEQKQINTYLNGLIDAFSDDIKYLNYTIHGNTFRTNCIKKILQWSTDKTALTVENLRYDIDHTYNSNQLEIGWTNKWMDSIPPSYDRLFITECFKRTSYGGIIVINQSTFDEFKNTGLFSNIKNEQLKRNINHYYALVNWHFSVWRESSYRQKIDEWESFLRNNYLTNTYDISHITDPIQLIKKNKDIQLELEKLLENAAGRVNASGELRETAKNLIVEIKEYVNKT